ncbi:spondin domain-containing protein [Halobacteria archaeon HArc-gm2]|nr:spondin domain-containing protein [Halobacteria archaeon HArc-gm2]
MTDAEHSVDGRNSAETSVVSRRSFVAAAGAATVGALGFGSAAARNMQGAQDHYFTVHLENHSNGNTLSTSLEGEGSSKPVPLSPVAYAVHREDEPIYSHGEPARGNGLEALAEDGSPGQLVSSLRERDSVVEAGATAVPVGADGPGPLLPGGTYEFSTDAYDGTESLSLSLVTMFVQSNDLFYSLGGPSGLPLFGEDGPTNRNVNDAVVLWDAGTEVNQEPGVGEHQAPRQRAKNVGDVERGTVAPVNEINGYDYPDLRDVLILRVTAH